MVLYAERPPFASQDPKMEVYPGWRIPCSIPHLVYPGWYIRLPPASLVYIPARTTLPLHSSSGLIALLAGVSTERASCLRKEGFLTSGINHPQGGNGPIMAKKPATESTCAQGTAKPLNPSATVLKPPLRLQPALSHRREEVRTIGDLPGVLVNSVQKVKNVPFVGAGFLRMCWE